MEYLHWVAIGLLTLLCACQFMLIDNLHRRLVLLWEYLKKEQPPTPAGGGNIMNEITMDTRVYRRIKGTWHVRTNGKWMPVTDGLIIIRLNRRESMKQKPLFA